MKTKLYRRVGGKHVKFNISKSGVSTSIKLGPITINPQRNTYSINTPIKGLSLRGKLVDDNEAKVEEPIVKSNKPIKLKDLDVCKPFFEELIKSLVENEFNDLIPYAETLLSECTNKKGADVELCINTIEALEEGLKVCDAEVDAYIYELLANLKDVLIKRQSINDPTGFIGVVFVILAIILGFVLA